MAAASTDERLERAAELEDKRPAEAIALLEAIIAGPDGSEAAVVKEQAVYRLGDLHAKQGNGEKLARLLADLRPFFATVPKAKVAKVVRSLIDQVAKIPDSMALQMRLCQESIAWCKAEKRSFLRQRLQTKLAALLLESKQYTEALAILTELQSEVKRLDDKPLLVEINLVESQTHYAVRNYPKAKASLTAARTNANAIYCPPLLQAKIDEAAGTLNAEEKDFKTAFSYFYEAFENYDSVSSDRAVHCLKYMLLSKIMMNTPEEVRGITEGKPGERHKGPALEAMLAVASAHQQRSLHDFEAALAKHEAQLTSDKIISRHLASLYDLLLQENICRIIEPYSNVEVAHIATLMNLPCAGRPRTAPAPAPPRRVRYQPCSAHAMVSVVAHRLQKVEEKLSQMILDKKFRGILDAGAGCLIVYDDQAPDSTFDYALEGLSNMGRVVDALHEKTAGLAPSAPALAAPAAKPAA